MSNKKPQTILATTTSSLELIAIIVLLYERRAWNALAACK